VIQKDFTIVGNNNKVYETSEVQLKEEKGKKILNFRTVVTSYS